MEEQSLQLLSSLHQPLTEESIRFVKVGLEGAPNTIRAYRADLNCYTQWCLQFDMIPFPAAPEQVANYISYLADRYKVSTLQRRLAMLSKFHELQNLDSPNQHRIVRITMDGIKREKGMKQKMAPAFVMEQFRQVILSLDENDPRQFRDKLVLLLGFTGAFRRSELVWLNLEDLQTDEEGILVELQKSKTDQYGKGQVKALFYAADSKLCPVRVLQRWVKTLDRDTGPLLVRIRKGDRITQERLHDFSVWKIVKQYLGDKFSAHSLRASFVTIARRNGADHAQIMQQTGHKTDAMVRRYTRFEDIRENNAAMKLGL